MDRHLVGRGFADFGGQQAGLAGEATGSATRHDRQARASLGWLVVTLLDM
jgi:hypothetical protein